VKHSISPDAESFEAVWQLILHLELMGETDIDKALFHESMRGYIDQYLFPTDFFERVLVSIWDVTSQAVEKLNTFQDQRRISLNIYMTADAKNRRYSNHNWGFFRIEKNGTAFNPNNASVHEIRFYLYLS
jgi:hypothetical protein